MLNVVSFLKKRALGVAKYKAESAAEGCLKVPRGVGDGSDGLVQALKGKKCSAPAYYIQMWRPRSADKLVGAGLSSLHNDSGGSKPHLTGQALCG